MKPEDYTKAFYIDQNEACEERIVELEASIKQGDINYAAMEKGFYDYQNHSIKIEAEKAELEAQVAKQQETIKGCRAIFHQYLRKTKEVRLLCLELEAENAKLQAHDVARAASFEVILAENAKLQGKMLERGKAEWLQLLEAAQAVVDSKTGMGHLIPSSVAFVIDDLARTLLEGMD